MKAFALRAGIAVAPAIVVLAIACSGDAKEAPPAAPPATPPAEAPATSSAPAPGGKAHAVPPSLAPSPGDDDERSAGERPALPARNEVFALEPPTLSLGVLEPNEERRVEFRVKNLSKQPLKILMVKTGCKCVTLDYSKVAIPAGGSTPVNVKVVGVTRESRRIAVTITTDDPRRSKAELAVFYSIVPPVDFLPPKGDFGKVKQGEKAELGLKVTLHLPPEIEKIPALEPFISHDLPIRITLDPPTLTTDAAGFRDVKTTLHLVLDTSKPLPSFQTELVVKPKEPKSFRLTTIPVLGEVRAGTFFEHDRLVFTGLTAGTPATKAIRLYFVSEKPPEFAEVSISPDEFTEKHELEADRHCVRFDVACTPRQAGAANGELRVKLAGSGDVLTVALTARSK